MYVACTRVFLERGNPGELDRCAPGAVAATKKLLDFVDRESPDACFRYTVDLVAAMWASAEAEEGIDSFLNKRAPSWRPTAPVTKT